MKLGYAQAVISPRLDKPVFLAGFSKNRCASDIHDDLTVRALVLSSATQILVLCTLDLLGFFRPHVQDVIRRVNEQFNGVIRPDIIISSIHTHHGPDTQGSWGPDDRTTGLDIEYIGWLKDKIVATIMLALADAHHAILNCKVALISVPGVAKNVRSPHNVDDELAGIQFMNERGHPLASLFNFPCHPEVLWEQNTHITADYPGPLRLEVENRTNAPCIFFSGALGGMMTPNVRDRTFEEAETMGKIIAEKGLQAVETVKGSWLSTMSLQRKEIRVKLKNILFTGAARRKLLSHVIDEDGFITSEVNLIKVNGLWLAAVSGELLPRHVMELKSAMIHAGAQASAVISLANDELGYILPKEDFHYPLIPLKSGRHYEETMSVSKEMGPIVVDAIVSLL